MKITKNGKEAEVQATANEEFTIVYEYHRHTYTFSNRN